MYLSRFLAMDDAGWQHLKRMPNLHVVRLHNTRVSATGVAALSVALPNCRIEVSEELQGELDSLRNGAPFPTKAGSRPEVLVISRSVTLTDCPCGSAVQASRGGRSAMSSAQASASHACMTVPVGHPYGLSNPCDFRPLHRSQARMVGLAVYRSLGVTASWAPRRTVST
jgi:hypothetical protein